MAFRPGDHVHVAGFGKGVVIDVRNGGRYLVEVKGRAMAVSGTQLVAVDTREPFPARSAKPRPEVPGALERSHAPMTIDLHGKTTDEAVAALDGFINDAILANYSEVSVIHGRSGGRVKAVVHQRLKKLPVRGFRLDPSNPGVTIVML